MKTTEHIIRRAGFEDAERICELVREFPKVVLPRSLADIVQNIDRFLVCQRGEEIVGTVSWQVLPEIGAPKSPSVEIKSLTVATGQQGEGVGRDLVLQAIRQITLLHPAQCVVLTFSPEFFRRLGFEEVPKEKLMHKLYAGCINCTKYDNPFTCPEVAMALEPGLPTGTEI
jgi:amino-acid N-acetyltransferase